MGLEQKDIDTNALQLKTESHFCIEDHVPGHGRLATLAKLCTVAAARHTAPSFNRSCYF
jgi:hypothetical protein